MRNDRDNEVLNDSPRLLPVGLPPNTDVPGLKALSLTASGLVFKMDEQGSVIGPNTITLTAELRAITGIPVFTVVEGTATLTALPEANKVNLLFEDMGTDIVVVEVSVEDVSTFKLTPSTPNTVYTSKVTIARLADGQDGLPGADGQDGADGITSRAVHLVASDQTVEYGADGKSPSPTSIQLTAHSVNTAGVVYYQFFVNDTLVKSSTSNSYSYSAPSEFDSLPAKIEVQIREGSSVGPILARDQTTVFGLREGSDGITVVLSNESHTVPALSDGTPTDFSGSGTSIECWHGTEQLVYDGTSPYQKGSYRITVATNGVTVGSATTVGNRRVYSGLTGFSGDSGWAEFTIVIQALDGQQRVFTRRQTFTKSKQGQAGEKGDTGSRATTGYLYYQLSSPSAPSKPSAAGYNFLTGTFSAVSTNWSVNPPTFEAGNTNKYWYARFHVTESNFSGPQTVTVSSPVQGIGFSGLVTFNGQEITDGSSTFNYTQIDGGWIKTGTMSAERIGTGKLTVNDTGVTGNTFSSPEWGTLLTPFILTNNNPNNHVGLHVRKTVNSQRKGSAIYGEASASAAAGAGVVGVNYKVNQTGENSWGVVGYHFDSGARAIGLGGYTYSIDTSSAGGEFSSPLGGVGLRVLQGTVELGKGYTSSDLGSVVHFDDGIGGTHRIDCYQGSMRFFKPGQTATGISFNPDGSILAPGGVTPFTGAHIGVIGSEEVELGDILMDTGVVYKIDISNAISVVTKTTTAGNAAVIGVLATHPTNIPVLPPNDVYYSQVPTSHSHPEGDTLTAPVVVGRGAESHGLSEAVMDTLRAAGQQWCTINSVGEGLINVCGGNGDISVGDLICSSSVPGKGQKQADGIIKNSTVAKSRETVKFSSPDEVKQIACIYLCG
jgi:hypothetical protein